MKPPPFAYAAPDTLEEAVGLLTEHAEAEPRVLAGGQSLIPLMNFRLAKPGYLVDLRNVAGLNPYALASLCPVPAGHGYSWAGAHGGGPVPAAASERGPTPGRSP